jgi:hypothetical protein
VVDAVRGQVVAVVEEDHPVAEPAPALVAAIGDDVRAAAVVVAGVRTSRYVAAH